MKNTQHERIKAILDNGGALTALDALYQVGTLKLSTRISEMIKDGYSVSKTWIKVKNRFGEEIRVIEYRKA